MQEQFKTKTDLRRSTSQGNIPTDSYQGRNTTAQISWIIDSGCSKHMTGCKDAFIKIETKKSGNINFGYGTGKIKGIGTIQSGYIVTIDNILFVPMLKYNLLSVS